LRATCILTPISAGSANIGAIGKDYVDMRERNLVALVVLAVPDDPDSPELERNLRGRTAACAAVVRL
jgi:hypothetical protein